MIIQPQRSGRVSRQRIPKSYTGRTPRALQLPHRCPKVVRQLLRERRFDPRSATSHHLGTCGASIEQLRSNSDRFRPTLLMLADFWMRSTRSMLVENCQSWTRLVHALSNWSDFGQVSGTLGQHWQTRGQVVVTWPKLGQVSAPGAIVGVEQLAPGTQRALRARRSPRGPEWLKCCARVVEKLSRELANFLSTLANVDQRWPEFGPNLVRDCGRSWSGAGSKFGHFFCHAWPSLAKFDQHFVNFGRCWQMLPNYWQMLAEL